MKLTDAQSRNVQVLRGLAIIAVVCIHNTPAGLAQVFVRPFLNFAVGLFLFLSGMLSRKDNWSPRKRIVKVLVPYVLWTLIYTAMDNLFTPARIPGVFLGNLISGNAAGMMYYIFIYCELTLLIPVIDRLARSRFRYWGFLISPVEIIVMRLIPLIAGIPVSAFVSSLMSLSCVAWFSYFYLGYLLGNGCISLKIPSKTVTVFWVVSMLLQVAEGYVYYSMGQANCGRQLKLSAVLTGMFFAMMAYSYVIGGKPGKGTLLKTLGDHSFGIYFSHLAVMWVLNLLPGYAHVPFPVNAAVATALTTVCVMAGKKILGKYSKYLAL